MGNKQGLCTWLQCHDMMGVMGTWWKDSTTRELHLLLMGLLGRTGWEGEKRGFPTCERAVECMCLAWEVWGWTICLLGAYGKHQREDQHGRCACLSQTMWLTRSRWGLFQSGEETLHLQALIYMGNFKNPISEGTAQKDKSNPWRFKEGIDTSSHHNGVRI